MRFTERHIARLGEADPLEQALRHVQRVVGRVRRNQWFGGDEFEPEYALVPVERARRGQAELISVGT